ncbi:MULTISPECIES: heterocyst frequency control protein PatD [unclassified Anabaena]|uniref:heterocyst frequency control protein PatD n=1 Tax=unclassified Anabaena TaxID=2619674 RepID=UPI0008340BC5|nr:MULTISPECIES: heterocyst frequency control protein PatD [unclassified Anabaena]
MSLISDKYQALVNLLEQLRTDVSNSQVSTPELKQGVMSLQQVFSQEILPLATDANSREQSYQTEISKQLRLLEVDVMFLQGARQSATSQARLKTISDRLSILIQYCHAILQQQTPE